VEELLSDLKSKRKALEKECQELDITISIVEKNIHEKSSNISTVIDTVNYSRMTIAEAAYKFLSDIRKPCTIEEIADSLRKSGVKSNSKNFVNTLGSILYRNKDIVRLGRGVWALKEWNIKY